MLVGGSKVPIVDKMCLPIKPNHFQLSLPM